MNNGVRKLYYLAINVALLLIMGAFITGNGGRKQWNPVELEPDEITQQSQGMTEYCYHIMEKELSGKGIAFFSNHQNVTVYCDSVRIYELQEVDSIWGHTTGSVWNFVHVPYGTNDVSIIMEPVYESQTMDTLPVIVANDRDLYSAVLEQSFFSMACSAIIILIGIVLIAVWHVVKKTDLQDNVFYLGVLALIFGLWSFNETNGAAIIFDNRVACSFMAFILLKLLGPTFVLFARAYVGETGREVWNVFSRLIIIDAVITISMHMLNIMDLKETVITTHIIIILSILYSFVIAGKAIRKKKVFGKRNLYILAAVVVIIAVVAVFVHYFSGGSDESGFNIIGRIGFLVFAILAAAQTANNALKMMEKGKYAAIYEELAIVDSLTGLYNRNAYQIDSKKLDDLTNVMIFTFDLNDLKECNDTKGHAQGDSYITTAAKMIEKLLGNYGYCYRIGGDEFCTIVRNSEICPAEELLLKLEMEQIKYNASITEEQYPIRIAAGYAMYDSKMDNNLEEMRERADIYMYRNKKKIKEEMEKPSV